MMMFSSGLKGTLWGIDDDFSAGEALSHIVVAVPFQLQGEPLWE